MIHFYITRTFLCSVWFSVVPSLQEKIQMGPGDQLVENSYISKCSTSRPKNSRFYEKFSETAASFTII
jgi:hypothetical protein